MWYIGFFEDTVNGSNAGGDWRNRYQFTHDSMRFVWRSAICISRCWPHLGGRMTLVGFRCFTLPELKVGICFTRWSCLAVTKRGPGLWYDSYYMAIDIEVMTFPQGERWTLKNSIRFKNKLLRGTTALPHDTGYRRYARRLEFFILPKWLMHGKT